MTTPAPSPGASPPDAPGRSTEDYHESSLWRWRGGRSLVIALLFAMLGWVLVAGALAYGRDDALAAARPEDLIRILDSLEGENERLQREQRRLETELASLESGTSAEALASARQRLESLEILAGTTPVRGSGVRIVIRDPQDGLDASDILDAVQELRDAGAESIEVAERRVVVNTWFADPPDSQRAGILISGDLREPPYTILAIGEPSTLATAMQIPGGVADSVRTAGAQFDIDERESLDITSTVPLVVPEYAEPAQEQ